MFTGFLITAGSIVWKGGKLEADLLALKKAVESLASFRDAMYVWQSESKADRAVMHQEIEDAARRIGAIEKRCDLLHRRVWDP
jgi:hypothetical protein